jgi:outer membrane protein insertion porin family
MWDAQKRRADRRGRFRLAILRGPLLSLLLLISPFSTLVHADVADFVGKPLADVRVELGGEPLEEPAVLQLIETRVGEPLRLEAVRDTIDHLIGLGRFEDVRVYAEASTTRAGAVALRWVLAPVQRIDRVSFSGALQLDAGALRGEISERLGPRPSPARVPEMIETLRAYYAERGFRAARIESRLVPGDAPENVQVVLTIDAGLRARLGSVSVTGTPPISPEMLITRLRLETGRPYDGPAIRIRIDGYADALRRLGYYEARADSSVRFSEDNQTANLTIDVDPGPRVRVVFAGDPLPENRRDTLVPIREERSVDLDLLEDASRNIEGFLRQQGYRSAQARYVREQRGDDMVLTFTVARGPMHTLASMHIVGNSALTSAELAPLMKLQAGEPFVDTRIATVASAMTELYQVRGFARATVKPEITLQASAETTAGGPTPVAVRFLIVEGPQTTVGTVSVRGANALPESRITELLALSSGKPFYRPQLDADRASIERAYRGDGFQEVRVVPESTPREDGRRVDVRWVIHEGVQTTIDHVLVTGNERTSDELIRRESALEPGKPLGQDALVESQRRLSALGLFRRVRVIELPHGARSRHDVLIEVEEAPSTSISEGGGLEAVRRLRPDDQGRAEAQFEVAPRGFFEVTRRNLWGKNRSVSLFSRISFRPRDPAIDSTDPADQGGYGFNEYRVVGTYREPRPFNRPGEAQLTGFFEQAVRASFNFNRRGGRAEYARRFGTWLAVSGRYAFDYTKLFDEKIRPEDRLLVDRLFPQVRLSTLTGSILRDSRNDVLDPERGTVFGIDGTIAPRFIGSEVGFARTFVQGFVYRRLPGAGRMVVAAAARIGLAVGFERTVERRDSNGQPVLGPDGEVIVDVVKDLPASERFFAGGDNTVRGFVLDQLGAEETLNDQGFPTGGNGLAVFNVELRAPYWKGLGAVAFLDAGNVFRRATDLSFTELRPAAGFGLRYRSPLGPLRIDLGFNLDRHDLPNGTRERGSVLHISLGQAF